MLSLDRPEFHVVGVTGGMGAGKSTVAGLLASHGAEVIDADTIAREVVEPGEPALAAIRDRYGPAVIADDGTLDRAALASIVFSDDGARSDLEAITHPAIRERIGTRLDELAAAGGAAGERQVVVLDHPLLVETGIAAQLETVVVVTAPVELRVERLVEGRDVDPEDARRRIATQADDEDRRAAATHEIANVGDEDDLAEAVAALWHDLTGHADG